MDYFDEKPKVAKRQPHKQKRKNNHKGYFGRNYKGSDSRKYRCNGNRYTEIPCLTTTSMTLLHAGKTYTINLDRKEANQYLGFKVEELSASDGSWNKKFSDSYIYDDAKRQQFFDKFVQAK